MLAREYPDIEFNIEGNPFAGPMASAHTFVSDYPGFMPLVDQAKPAQCTLVPDSNSQLTSDHGFDLSDDTTELQSLIARCHAAGSRVSLFMDPDCEQIKRARDIGADRIELYTGPYADLYLEGGDWQRSLASYAEAAQCALDCGLGVNAGHDLNLKNLPDFISIPGLAEVSIGHAFTIDCIEMGLTNAVKAYTDILHK
jgi:pyridoxine 5-phosphate synthase